MVQRWFLQSGVAPLGSDQIKILSSWINPDPWPFFCHVWAVSRLLTCHQLNSYGFFVLLLMHDHWLWAWISKPEALVGFFGCPKTGEDHNVMSLVNIILLGCVYLQVEFIVHGKNNRDKLMTQSPWSHRERTKEFQLYTVFIMRFSLWYKSMQKSSCKFYRSLDILAVIQEYVEWVITDSICTWGMISNLSRGWVIGRAQSKIFEN